MISFDYVRLAVYEMFSAYFCSCIRARTETIVKDACGL